MMLKSSSAGLFLFLLIFILNLSVSLQTPTEPKKFVHVEQKMNQSEARKYCKENHAGLAAFDDKAEFQSAEHTCSWVGEKKNLCWIDLEKDESDAEGWRWSNGDESTTYSLRDILNLDRTSENGKCVATGKDNWFDVPCDQSYEILCNKGKETDQSSEKENIPVPQTSLVQENKTWEEALDHCRGLETDPALKNEYFNHVYDLPHMDFKANSFQGLLIRDSQTTEVWIGLRFLAGIWLWVNRYPLQEQLPSCPAPNMHCGTMSKTGQVFHSRNCSERRNFICLKR